MIEWPWVVLAGFLGLGLGVSVGLALAASYVDKREPK